MIGAEERLARLRLCRSETIGPITFYRLLSRFGSAFKALEALPHIKLGKKSINIVSEHAALAELESIENFGGRLIIHGDPDYPYLLAQIEDAPPVLSVLGNIDILQNQKAIAIVGARNASANARRLASKIAIDLGMAGYGIVSGLARGIDTAAHEASLRTGTVAVLAGGLDEIYPQENTDLYNAITENGCVISEMPLGTKPTSHHFPRRNRIVSGLAQGTIIVEATLRSGSLITARLAAEQGRDVFAVPGFPGDPRAEGPNKLIREGAKLVQSAQDVIDDLTLFENPKTPDVTQPTFDGIADAFTPFEMHSDDGEDLQSRIANTLSHTPMHVDEVVRLCDSSASHIQTILLDMELDGTVHRHPGNRVSRAA